MQVPPSCIRFFLQGSCYAIILFTKVFHLVHHKGDFFVVNEDITIGILGVFVVIVVTIVGGRGVVVLVITILLLLFQLLL